MCYCFRRGKASFNDRIWLRRFNDGCIRFILMALFAGIGEVNILTNDGFCRDYLKMLGHLLADNLHLFTALGTFALFFTEFVFNGVGLNVLRKLVEAAGLFLSGVLFDSRLGRLLVYIFYELRFVKEQGDPLIKVV